MGHVRNTAAGACAAMAGCKPLPLAGKASIHGKKEMGEYFHTTRMAVVAMTLNWRMQNQQSICMRTLGIVLVIIGIVMMAITGFNYVTKKKVVDLGPVEINKEESHPVQWSPIVGGILAVGGIALLMSARKKA